MSISDLHLHHGRLNGPEHGLKQKTPAKSNQAVFSNSGADILKASTLWVVMVNLAGHAAC